MSWKFSLPSPVVHVVATAGLWSSMSIRGTRATVLRPLSPAVDVQLAWLSNGNWDGTVSHASSPQGYQRHALLQEPEDAVKSAEVVSLPTAVTAVTVLLRTQSRYVEGARPHGGPCPQHSVPTQRPLQRRGVDCMSAQAPVQLEQPVTPPEELFKSDIVTSEGFGGSAAFQKQSVLGSPAAGIIYRHRLLHWRQLLITGILHA